MARSALCELENTHVTWLPHMWHNSMMSEIILILMSQGYCVTPLSLQHGSQCQCLLPFGAFSSSILWPRYLPLLSLYIWIYTYSSIFAIWRVFQLYTLAPVPTPPLPIYLNVYIFKYICHLAHFPALYLGPCKYCPSPRTFEYMNIQVLGYVHKHGSWSMLRSVCMCLCVYIYICIYICTQKYLDMYITMTLGVSLDLYISMYVSMYIHLCLYLYAHIQILGYVHKRDSWSIIRSVYKGMYVSMCILLYMYLYTHIQVLGYVRKRDSRSMLRSLCQYVCVYVYTPVYVSIYAYKCTWMCT